MEISAPCKEAFLGAGVPRAAAGRAGTQPSMDAESFVEVSVPDAEAFSETSVSMEAQKAAAVVISRERHDAREPLMMSKQGDVYYRKGRCIRRIENKKRTFDKSCNRLFKEAFELSVLCDAEVGAFVFSPSGKVSEFASSSTSHIIRRYQSFQPQMPSNNVILQDVKRQKLEADLMSKKINFLQDFQRGVFDKENMSLTMNEVKSSETMLKDTLIKISKRKSDLFEVEAQEIIEKGKIICKESNVLQQKVELILSTKECGSNVSNQ